MLSDKAIQALRPDPERPGTKHHDRDGLYLWVARSGSKTWRITHHLPSQAGSTLTLY